MAGPPGIAEYEAIIFKYVRPEFTRFLEAFRSKFGVRRLRFPARYFFAITSTQQAALFFKEVLQDHPEIIPPSVQVIKLFSDDRLFFLPKDGPEKGAVMYLASPDWPELQVGEEIPEINVSRFMTIPGNCAP